MQLRSLHDRVPDQRRPYLYAGHVDLLRYHGLFVKGHQDLCAETKSRLCFLNMIHNYQTSCDCSSGSTYRHEQQHTGRHGCADERPDTLYVGQMLS